MPPASPNSTSSAPFLNDEAAVSAGASKRQSAMKPGQTITDSRDLVAHQGYLYVGARPERYVSRAGEDSVINIIAVDWDSQPIAEQEIDVQVIERRWTRSQQQDLETGRVKTTWDVEEIPVTSGNVTTGLDGKARYVFLPPNGGSFHIIVSTRDELGNKVSAITRAWVSSRSLYSLAALITTSRLSWSPTRMQLPRRRQGAGADRFALPRRGASAHQHRARRRAQH